MTQERPDHQSASITITGSTIDSSALLAGSGAQAEVTVHGSRTDESTRHVRELIDQLRSELSALDDADARTAGAAAQAGGQLEALDKEVTREERRPGHLRVLLEGLVTTVSGSGLHLGDGGNARHGRRRTAG